MGADLCSALGDDELEFWKLYMSIPNRAFWVIFVREWVHFALLNTDVQAFPRFLSTFLLDS